MFIGIAIFLILMFMGGIIAFLGDKIGSKVGKRRLSLFGLRPRYTSIIVTIISGILISFCTVAVMAVVNENVRVALFGLTKLRTEMASLNSDITAKNDELVKGKQLLDTRTQEYQEMNDKANVISDELARTEEQKEYMQNQLTVVQQAYDQAQTDVNTSAEEIQTLENTRKQLTDNISTLSDEKNALIQNISAIREGTVLFRAGQVISSAVVEKGLDNKEAGDVLSSILTNTNNDLRERLGIQNKDTIVVRVLQNTFDDAVNAIAGSSRPKLIRVKAAGNIIVGESTVVEFDIHDNLLVFKSGEPIITKDIRDYKKYKTGDMKVIQFLHDLNLYATEQGVLPDPITGNVGQLEGQELMETIQKVKSMDDDCILTAYAAKDIYTEGPVVIHVQVQKRAIQ